MSKRTSNKFSPEVRTRAVRLTSRLGRPWPAGRLVDRGGLRHGASRQMIRDQTPCRYGTYLNGYGMRATLNGQTGASSDLGRVWQIEVAVPKLSRIAVGRSE